MMARGGFAVAAVTLAALVLAGCSTTRTSSRVAQQPPALQPLPSSTVAQGNLPPIGQDGSVTVAQPGMVNPNLTGQPTTTGPTMAPAPLTPTIGQPTQTAAIGADPGLAPGNDGGFVTLDSVGSVPATPGRDLSSGLSEGKLIGGWTVISGTVQCRLNLTQTQSTTGRYRASTPGCQLPGLAAVSSWQLAGSQVQLFDENNNMVAAMILSGNRFIGTLAGGQGISMTS
jgi:hypothetical protein